MGIKAMKNEKEFLGLIDLYKRIDIDWLEEVAEEQERYEHQEKEEWVEGIMGEITGFDCRGTCTLCKAVKEPTPEKESIKDMRLRHDRECSNCAYVIMTGEKCFRGINAKTFEAFKESYDVEELKETCNARAKHMEDIYTKFKDNEIQRKGSIT